MPVTRRPPYGFTYCSLFIPVYNPDLRRCLNQHAVPKPLSCLHRAGSPTVRLRRSATGGSLERQCAPLTAHATHASIAHGTTLCPHPRSGACEWIVLARHTLDESPPVPRAHLPTPAQNALHAHLLQMVSTWTESQDVEWARVLAAAQVEMSKFILGCQRQKGGSCPLESAISPSLANMMCAELSPSV